MTKMCTLPCLFVCLLRGLSDGTKSRRVVGLTTWEGYGFGHTQTNKPTFILQEMSLELTNNQNSWVQGLGSRDYKMHCQVIETLKSLKGHDCLKRQTSKTILSLVGEIAHVSLSCGWVDFHNKELMSCSFLKHSIYWSLLRTSIKKWNTHMCSLSTSMQKIVHTWNVQMKVEFFELGYLNCNRFKPKF